MATGTGDTPGTGAGDASGPGRPSLLGRTWRLPSLLLAVLFATDVLLGERAVLIGFFAVPPLLAAAVATVPATMAVAVLALLAALAAGISDGIGGSADHVIRCLVVAAVGAVAVPVAMARQSRERALARVTTIAETAQMAVLRTLPTAVGRVHLAARYVSATSEALIGGDLYEVVATPYGVRIIVGDVRGKGLPAVRLAALVLGVFRAHAFDQPDLAELARDLDLAVARDVADADRVDAGEDFVTAVLVQVEEDGGLTVVNCGHHPPLVTTGDRYEVLDVLRESPPLGLGVQPDAQRYDWADGQRLFLYTDGLVEARAPHGGFFALERATTCLAADRDLERCLDDMVADLLAHVGGDLSDDLALVLAERSTGRDSGRVVVPRP